MKTCTYFSDITCNDTASYYVLMYYKKYKQFKFYFYCYTHRPYTTEFTMSSSDLTLYLSNTIEALLSSQYAQPVDILQLLAKEAELIYEQT